RAEINNWMALINDNALNSSQVALGFVTSNEYLSKTIAQDYQQFLGRSPQPSEVGGWLDQISLNGLTLQQITAGFLSSKEYSARKGGKNLSWLTGMYQDVLGRTPDLNGFNAWDMAMQGGQTRQVVVNGFLRSKEGTRTAVSQAYQTVLGRTP